MDLILVKIFATALALSEVMTQPQAVKTHFDAVADQDKVVQTLRAGCAHMRRAFDIESINVDELISTALNDQKAVGTGIKAFHGINFADLNVAYHRFCKNENVGDSVVDLRQVIEFFNDAAADLPDHAATLPVATSIAVTLPVIGSLVTGPPPVKNSRGDRSPFLQALLRVSKDTSSSASTWKATALPFGGAHASSASKESSASVQRASTLQESRVRIGLKSRHDALRPVDPVTPFLSGVHRREQHRRSVSQMSFATGICSSRGRG